MLIWMKLKRSVWTLISASVTVMELVFLFWNEYNRDFRDLCPTSCFEVDLEQVVRFWVLFVGAYSFYLGASVHFMVGAYRRLEELKREREIDEKYK